MHQQDDSSTGWGFLESSRSVTYPMLWNLVNLIGADALYAICVYGREPRESMFVPRCCVLVSSLRLQGR